MRFQQPSVAPLTRYWKPSRANSTTRQSPPRRSVLCNSIDSAHRNLTIPIASAAPAVQSNEVYPPICLLALINHFRIGG